MNMAIEMLTNASRDIRRDLSKDWEKKVLYRTMSAINALAVQNLPNRLAVARGRVLPCVGKNGDGAKVTVGHVDAWCNA